MSRGAIVGLTVERIARSRKSWAGDGAVATPLTVGELQPSRVKRDIYVMAAAREALTSRRVQTYRPGCLSRVPRATPACNLAHMLSPVHAELSPRCPNWEGPKYTEVPGTGITLPINK